MRDDAPVTAFAHLVSDSMVLEVKIITSPGTKLARQGPSSDDGGGGDVADSCPTVTFNNDKNGNEAASAFCEQYLLPLLDEDFQPLREMVRLTTNCPRQGVEFRDVLGISKQPGGVALCNSLLRSDFAGDWTKVDVIACCETSGIMYASVLATHVNIPLALIRDAGKLPPPTISVSKSSSYISSSGSTQEKTVKMGTDAVRKGGSVVIVDDVLASGETLCTVLKLLGDAGIGAENVSVMVVAELPVHRGRELSRQLDFGRVKVQSLVVPRPQCGKADDRFFW